MYQFLSHLCLISACASMTMCIALNSILYTSLSKLEHHFALPIIPINDIIIWNHIAI